MGRALAGPGVTPPQALLAVEGAVPALELIDFRYAGKPTAIDAVADGVLAKAVVLGAPLTDVTHLDLALEGLVYEVNGADRGDEHRGRGPGQSDQLARVDRQSPRRARARAPRRATSS